MPADGLTPSSTRFKITVRVLTAGGLFLFSLLVFLNQEADPIKKFIEFSNDILNGLDNVDIYTYIFHPRGAFANWGWTGALFLCASAGLAYVVLRWVRGEELDILTTVVAAIFCATMFAPILKNILLALLAIFGAAIGFSAWISGIVWAALEFLLSVHHTYRSGVEFKDAAKEIYTMKK